MLLRRTRIALAGLLALLVCAAPAAAQDVPAPAPAAPCSSLADPGDAFGRYDAEILRAEGLNAFAVDDAGGAIDAATLAGYRVVVLAQRALSDAEVAVLTALGAGRRRTSSRCGPDPKLAPLLGLAGAGAGTVAQGYLDVDGSTRARARASPDVPMQFHGVADRWIVDGARTVATLQRRERRGDGVAAGDAARRRHAGRAGRRVHVRPRGVGGRDAPGQPGRSRAIEGDGQPSGLRSERPVRRRLARLRKVRIPQADEQQRLLANLVTQMSLDVLPMPRFWYLPRGEKAAVVMTGDDHAQGGTIGAVRPVRSPTARRAARSPEWECVRATSYLYTGSSIQPATAQQWRDQGFELSLHLNTDNCATYTDARARGPRRRPARHAARERRQLPARRVDARPLRRVADLGGHGEGRGRAGASGSTRTTTSGRPAWALTRPGMFTGSGFPMRFADTDGTIIDVYQATTQLTDELDPDRSPTSARTSRRCSTARSAPTATTARSR